MKFLTLILLILTLQLNAFAQSDSAQADTTIYYKIKKTDKTELVAKILKKDLRELLVKDMKGREFYLPQYMVEEIIELKDEEVTQAGKFIGDNAFSTRYVLTTNGLPVKKGDHYTLWSIIGPDFQFGLGKNLGVGVMTSWLAIPVIGTIKKSWTIGPQAQVAIGGLAGSGTWTAPKFGGLIGFGSLSVGDRTKNLTASTGYGQFWNKGEATGRTMLSLAGMTKISAKISLVFDSFFILSAPDKQVLETKFIYTNDPTTGQMIATPITQTVMRKQSGFTLLIPAIRWHLASNQAFQFGFSAARVNQEWLPVPIPVLQWFRKL